MQKIDGENGRVGSQKGKNLSCGSVAVYSYLGAVQNFKEQSVCLEGKSDAVHGVLYRPDFWHFKLIYF